MRHRDPEADAEPGGLFAWFPRNGIAANILMLMFLVGGMLTLLGGRVRTEVFPEVKPNIVTVSVVYPGATPAEVEQGALTRIEEAVAGITGVDKITATASEGAGSVAVEALVDADLVQVYNDVKNRVDAITSFPDEIEEPIIAQLVMRKEVINVALYGDAEEHVLKELGERVRTELTGLPQISQVELSAVRPYEVSIEVSEAALQRHGLTFDAVADAVRRSSLDLPAGAIKAASGQTLLRIQGQAYRGEDFARLVLLTAPDGTRVTLGEVATVVDGFADDDLASRFDGQRAVLLKVFRIGDQDALVITQAVRDWVATEGRALLPHGLSMTTWRDESVILRGRIQLLLSNAAQGGVIVLALLALFLQFRLAIWVALGIPVAFLGALMVAPFFDVSLNMISLFAFLLVLGIVVDDAIVVGENIMLERQRTGSPLAAALRGARRVRVPVFASVMTTICAFLPMFNVPGADAQIWRVIPLIVIPVLVGSLIESQLILPAHLAHIPIEPPPPTPLRRALAALALPWTWVQTRFQRALQWFIDRVYQPTADAALRWRYLTIATSVAAMIVLVGSVASGHPRFQFFPSVDGDNVVVSLTMPQGTPIETTTALIRRIERAAERVRAEVDAEQGYAGTDKSIVQHMLASVGSQPWATDQARNAGDRSATGASGSHLAELNVQLLPSEERELGSTVFQTRLREAVGRIPDAVELSFTSSFFSTGKDVDVQLTHDDLDVLQRAADQLELEMLRRPDIKDVTDSFRLGKEEVELRIDPRAEVLGLTQQDLARQVRQAFFGEEAQRVQRGRDEVKVMVRYPEADRRSLADLDQLRIRTRDGAEVPFHEVADATFGRSLATITRVDQKRTVRVSGDIDENDPNASPEAINAELRDHVLPALTAHHPGLGWSFEGDQKNKADLMRSLLIGFVFALFGIYALIAIPLRSYVQPFLIMTAIPFGFGGAILGHLVTGNDLSIMSMFGAIALAGVVVNDNIVLVDTINEKRENARTVLEAVRDAGARRFRPILLTSLTTFGGLMPLLMEKSVQAKFLVPMAVSLGFGVVFATAVSLLIVPSIYLVIEDGRRALAWLYGGGSRREPAPGARAEHA
ncbi:MAG: efflux RND transporter permease subunit [Planctomycetota bacterium]